MPLFGAAYAAPNKGTPILYRFRSTPTAVNLKETRNDVYETLCPQPFACQEGFISFQCPNVQRAIT